MDAADAKQARETYAKVHGEQPPDSYYLSLVEADEAVIRLAMKTAPGRAFNSVDDFRQQCLEGETALYHIDTTEPELTQLY